MARRLGGTGRPVVARLVARPYPPNIVVDDADGLDLHVGTADAGHLRGRWEAYHGFGRGPSGWFCARRVGP